MAGFDALLDRLVHNIRRRIRQGELTERGLARAAGVSQPHLHNLLKGIRTLHAAIADQLMNRLGINTLDLFETDELRHALYLRLVDEDASVELPVTLPRLGPGLPFPQKESDFERIKAPVMHVSRTKTPVFARLSDDPAMAPLLAAGDLVLLDRKPRAAETAGPEDLLAVERGGEAVVRWVRFGRRRLYLLSVKDRDEPHRWEAVAGEAAIRARVIPLRSMRRAELLYDPLLPPRDRPPAPVRRSSSN